MSDDDDLESDFLDDDDSFDGAKRKKAKPKAKAAAKPKKKKASSDDDDDDGGYSEEEFGAPKKAKAKSKKDESGDGENITAKNVKNNKTNGIAAEKPKRKKKKAISDDDDDDDDDEDFGMDDDDEDLVKKQKKTVKKANVATKSKKKKAGSDDDDNDSLLGSDSDEGGVKMATPTKKASKPKKKKNDDDENDYNMDIEDDDNDVGARQKNASNLGRSSTEKQKLATKYQKVSQYEHVLLRPDTYIGSIEKSTQKMWVMEEVANGEYLTNKEITYVPGLYKIFDEILVNAADHKRRDTSMKAIKVVIEKDTGLISVWNDGNGIPVEIHPVHEVYYPDFLFGDLLTGENFDDNEARLVGGRNGYGAKLANIFSTQFEVETQDAKSGHNFYKKWTANMSKSDKPVISKYKGKSDYTKVTFIPDYTRFGMENGLDADTLSLLTKRVYDMAGVTDKSVSVWLNGTQIKINGFEKYVDLYLKRPSQINSIEESRPESSAAPEILDVTNDSINENGEEKDDEEKKKKASGATASSSSSVSNALPKIYERINERWEICVSISDGQADQVSFVNAICTSKGGQHVQYVADQIATFLIEVVKKKNKGGAQVKPHQIKSHLWIFVNCLIVNPAFDSQTKETLTTKPTKFGEKQYLPTLSQNTLNKISKSGVVENILFWANAKSMRDLKKIAGGKKARITGIAKLNDANNAGSKDAEKCTLILTEGDSAMSLALTGISVVGRDNYGVFPLKGKLLNVRDATHSQIMKNEEIQNLMKIIGLQPGKVYDSVKGLRYGHVMIMTDQDQDGSHIKGLLFNFFHHFWPSLVHMDGFLRVFITPIVKVTKDKTVLSFFSLPDYEDWKKSIPTKTELARWTVKYYKGLGTNGPQEAASYFRDLDKHQIDMKYEGQIADNSIDMAFSKKRVNDRKTWLENFTPEIRVDFDVDTMSYSDFVNQELIQFSMADNCRSIPNIADGLKTSQRKVLFAAFKRKLKQEIKVAQFAGYVAEHSAYHHGEASLTATIVGMAQDFVGSNNVNFLFPSGAFGTRRLGGKDAASARYIFTRMGDLTRFLFREEDDDLFPPLNDDGQDIEPAYYLPIIPTILVNGASGIGTGWSTDIPPHDPLVIIEAIRSRIKGNDNHPVLTPWYRGFTGDIVPEKSTKKNDANPEGNLTNTGRYVITGKYELDSAKETIRITELPIGSWTNNYKEWLEDIVTGNDVAKKDEAKAADKTKGNNAKGTTATNANGGDNANGEGGKKKGGGKKKSKKKNNEGGEEGGNGADVDDEEDEDFQESGHSSSSDDDEDEGNAGGKRGGGGGAKKKPIEEEIKLSGQIKEYKEYHGDNTVDFEIYLTTELFQKLQTLAHEKILKKFHLITTVSTSNMIAFNQKGSITKYKSCDEILDEFYLLRKEFYEKRKELLQKKLEVEVDRATELARFIKDVTSGDIKVSNSKMKDVLATLQKKSYKKISEINSKLTTLKSNLDLDKKTTKLDEDDDLLVGADASTASLLEEYAYLVKVALYNLTLEKAKRIIEESERKQVELDILRKKTPSDLWESDLEVLEEQLIVLNQRKLDDDIQEKKIRKNPPKRKNGAKGRRTSGDGKKKAKRGRYSDDEDELTSDDDLDEDDDDDFSDDSYGGPKKVQKKAPVAAKKVTKPPAKEAAATTITTQKASMLDFVTKGNAPIGNSSKTTSSTTTAATSSSSSSLAEKLEKRLEASNGESKKADKGDVVGVDDDDDDSMVIESKTSDKSKAVTEKPAAKKAKTATSKPTTKKDVIDVDEAPIATSQRSRPARSAAAKKIVVDIDSDDDGDDDESEFDDGDDSD